LVSISAPPPTENDPVPESPLIRFDSRVMHPTVEEVLRLSAGLKPMTGQHLRRRSNPDRVIEVGVNVPFKHYVTVAELAEALRSNQVPERLTAHLGRFLGEFTLTEILCFCDRHGIDGAALSRFLRDHGTELLVNRPDLKAHPDALAGP
jgi:hypothetical protein